MNRRVVITGTGILSCVGNNVKDFWHSVVNGICGLDRITKIDVSQYRTQIGGEIHDFDITKYMPIKEAKRLDPFCQFAIAAADEALKEAGLETLDGIDRTKVGCLVSSGIGGLITLFDQTKVVLERGPSRTSPLLIPMMIGDMASGALSIRYGATGPNMGIVTAWHRRPFYQ